MVEPTPGREDPRLRATTDGTPALPVLTPQEWETLAGRSRRRGGPRRTRRGSNGRSSKGPGSNGTVSRLGQRLVATCAAVTIGVSGAILALHTLGGPAPRASGSAEPVPEVAGPPPSEPPTTPASAPIVPVSQPVLSGVRFAPLTIADVRATSTPRVVTLRVELTRSAQLVLKVEGRNTSRTQRVRARPGVRKIQFTALPAGSAQWTVRVADELPVTGRVVVAEPTPPRAPSSTPTPVPVNPAPVNPVAPPPAVPAPKPPPKNRGGGKRPPKPGGTGGKSSPLPRDPDDPRGGGPIPG